MSSVDVPLKDVGWGKTRRTDNWWIEPLLTFLGYAAFLVYANWRVLENANYEVPGTGYLAPMYSPLLMTSAPTWWPAFIPFSAAMLVLWAPAGFRMTCYYYRGAYYKAFWADPPNCTVGEPRKTYLGENKLPLIVQNVHRYALYFALVFIVLLAIDAWHGLWFDDGAGGKKFGVGLGSLILIINVTLIGGYTLGCHSLRHLVGGVFDLLSGKPIRKKAYDCVSCLNRHHPKWAWCSLVWVGWTDIYIRLCATGVITDWRII